jgi:hypothetical protein
MQQKHAKDSMQKQPVQTPRKFERTAGAGPLNDEERKILLKTRTTNRKDNKHSIVRVCHVNVNSTKHTTEGRTEPTAVNPVLRTRKRQGPQPKQNLITRAFRLSMSERDMDEAETQHHGTVDEAE